MKPVAIGRLPRGVEEYLGKLSFTAVLPTAWYACDSPADMSRLALGARNFHAEIVGSIAKQDPALAAQEADSTDRILCDWRWKGFLPFNLDDTTLVVRNAAQAAALARHVRAVCKGVLASLTTLIDREGVKVRDDAVYPINKGKSAPFWVPGSNREGAIALAAITNLSHSVDELNERSFSLGAEFPLLITLYTRIQAAKKPRAILLLDGSGRATESGEALLPKVRKVQAVAFVMNYAYARIGGLLMSAVRESGQGLLPEIDLAQAACGGVERDRLFGEDVSNFDDSVGGELYELITDALILPACRILLAKGVLDKRECDLIESVERALASMSVLGPPRNGSEAAVIVTRYGGIVSGERLTSIKGTIINAARARWVSEQSGAEVDSFLTFGDDTLIVAKTERDSNRYSDFIASGRADQEVGFKSTAAADPSFLQRRMPWGYGYLGRMILSTMQKEDTHEPRSLPIAALGITARRLTLRGHPYAAQYDVFCQAHAGRRIHQAYILAAELGFDVGRISQLVERGVGADPVRGGGAHTEEELRKVYAGLSKEEDGTEIARLLAAIEQRSMPSVASIDEAAQQFIYDGRIVKAAFKKAIGLS